jgi:hypothetical protein
MAAGLLRQQEISISLVGVQNISILLSAAVWCSQNITAMHVTAKYK